jgi:hypothetical protein
MQNQAVPPDDEIERQMPEGDQITLTSKRIAIVRANGSFTNATIEALGVPHKPEAGWAKALIGTTISREKFKAALVGKYIYRKKRDRE